MPTRSILQFCCVHYFNKYDSQNQPSRLYERSHLTPLDIAIHTAQVTMPIYEYRCRGCQHEFEAVILPNGTPPACPECRESNLEKLISQFAVSSDGTRASNLQSARKQASKIRRDKEVADHEAIHHHHH